MVSRPSTIFLSPVSPSFCLLGPHPLMTVSQLSLYSGSVLAVEMWVEVMDRTLELCGYEDKEFCLLPTVFFPCHWWLSSHIDEVTSRCLSSQLESKSERCQSKDGQHMPVCEYAWKLSPSMLVPRVAKDTSQCSLGVEADNYFHLALSQPASCWTPSLLMSRDL